MSVKLALVNRAENLQGVAMFVFACPFVLCSGIFGVLSDRYSKRSIIILAKVLEIIAMLLGAVAFMAGSLPGLLAVLGLMGAHSAFFGPAKYGILPELFRSEDLPRVNGWMLMTTFVSIILGVALAGELMVRLEGRLWLASWACIGTAVVGTLTALPIRRTPAAQPGLPITWGAMFVPHETRALLKADRILLSVLLASSVFWCVGGVYQQGVNDLGILQLRIDAAVTGRLGAAAAIGIAIGCALAGKLSRGRFEARLVKVGLWGMLITLCLLAAPGPQRGGTLLGVGGSAVTLVFLGASAGMFTVPITVFLQAMAPSGQKGQLIGVMNLCNWIGILLSAVLHFTASRALAWAQLPANGIFLVAVALLIPLAIWYRPVSCELKRPEV